MFNCALMHAGIMVHHVRMGGKIKACVEQLPQLQLEASIQPITRTVLRVKLTIHCKFRWNDKVSLPVYHLSITCRHALLQSDPKLTIFIFCK